MEKDGILKFDLFIVICMKYLCQSISETLPCCRDEMCCNIVFDQRMIYGHCADCS